MMEHTVEVCPARVEHRRVLVEGSTAAIAALVEAIVRGGPEVWEAVTSFCEVVMQAKEEAKYLRERLAADLRLRRHPRRRPVRQTSRDELRRP